VEVFNLGVLESIRDTNAFGGVEGHHLLHEVQTLLAALALEFLEPRLGALVHALEEGGGQRGVDALNVLRGGLSDHFDHLLHLVECGGTGEERFTHNQFTQDAAAAPHVHCFRVHCAPQQDLRCPLPARSNLVRENGSLVVVVFLRNRPCEPKVCQLQVTLRVQQQIGGFEVSVDEFTCVEVLECLQQLLNDVLLVDVFQDVSSDDCMQVSFHLVEYTVDVFVIFSSNYVE